MYRAIIADSIRDMVHIVSTNGGSTFTKPVKISNDNWVINGCPHTGPAVTENNSGLHFAWFTAGSGTGVFYNHSSDNGKTFSTKDSLSSRTGRHPQLTALSNGNIAIVWDETFPNGSAFDSKIGFELRSSDGAKIMKEYLTASGNASFPVIQVVSDHRLIVAYTSVIGEQKNVFYKLINLK